MTAGRKSKFLLVCVPIVIGGLFLSTYSWGPQLQLVGDTATSINASYTPSSPQLARTGLAGPSIVSAPPSTKTALPRTESAPPKTESALPHTESDLPHTESAPPSAKPSLSSTESALPHTESDLPHTESAPPSAKPSLSSTESALPYTKSASPSTSAITLSSSSSETASWDRITSVAEMYERMVIATAFSSNHFEEAKSMIASVQKCLPGKKIIVYDLGLVRNQRKQVRRYCNVELRRFPFDKYKPYMKNLHYYSWKAVVVKKVSVEYDVIMYGDTSLKMISCNITKALAYLFEFPFLCTSPAGFRAIEFTHDGMIKYLGYPPTREFLAGVKSVQAGCWLMWANSAMREKVIEPWLDCSLHKECIAPIGSKLHPCHFLNVHNGVYADCHRYDQSALNIILTREFGLDAVEKASKSKITKSVWKIVKGPSNEYKVSLCT